MDNCTFIIYYCCFSNLYYYKSMNEPKPIMYIYNLLEDVLSFHKSLDQEERSSVTSYITSLFGEFYFLGVISEFKNIRK